MLKQIFISTLFLLPITFLFGQNITSNDNKVYSAFIRTEILSNTKSVTIIKKLQNDSSSRSWVTEAIRSKDVQQLEQLRFLTRDENGNSIRTIDSATQNLILSFYEARSVDSTLTNLFDKNLQIFLVDNYIFKNGSPTEWRKFYRKYPRSGGLFQFSNISYSQNGNTAIFYHSVLRNGLGGHGALVIMTNINGEWKLKYHTSFWQA